MTKPAPRERAKDIAGALGFILLGGIVLREMRLEELPAQAAKYPSLLVYLMFALCALLIAKAVLGLGQLPGEGLRKKQASPRSSSSSSACSTSPPCRTSASSSPAPS